MNDLCVIILSETEIKIRHLKIKLSRIHGRYMRACEDMESGTMNLDVWVARIEMQEVAKQLKDLDPAFREDLYR